ncbi:hypothetical protein D9M69_465950 [compost metagenome]
MRPGITRPTPGAGEKVAYTWRAMFMKPRQLGPTSRTPAARALSPSRACAAAPSAPTSAKPEENSTTPFTPAAMASSSAPSTSADGTARMARSTGWPMARRLGKAGRSWMRSAFGLTGYSAPSKPKRRW